MSDVVTCPGCGKNNRLHRAAKGSPRCGTCGEALPWLTSAGDSDFDLVAGQAALPVLVDLWAPWCGPCRLIAPVVEEVARKLAGRLKVVKVNVDEAPLVSSRYEVKGIPTLLLLHAGRVVDRRTGALPANALREWVEQAISRQPA